MNFKLWIESEKITSRQQAISILGISFNASIEDAKRARNKLALIYHPDRNPSPDAIEKMFDINNAVDYLAKNKSHRTSNQSDSWYHSDVQDAKDYSKRRQEREAKKAKEREPETPPWQTDYRPANNDVGDNFSNKNFCLKDIYEYSIRRDPVGRWNLIAFNTEATSFNNINGVRSTLSVFTNDRSLSYAAEVMQKWSGEKFPYNISSLAVFAQKDNDIKLVRINDTGLNHMGIYIDKSKVGDSGFANIWNDINFIREVKATILKYENHH